MLSTMMSRHHKVALFVAYSALLLGVVWAGVIVGRLSRTLYLSQGAAEFDAQFWSIWTGVGVIVAAVITGGQSLERQLGKRYSRAAL